MARKRKKESKTVRATSITPVEPGTLGRFKKTEETIKVDEANTFQALCMAVGEVLRTSPEGQRLNCRLKILVENKEAIIYQGMLGNVWGRLRVDGRHLIYRHALKSFLIEHPKVKDSFVNL
tara:strand:+ start:1196 stop:1558 length:363 start_codon:yes stop_codon:yes gene_type:complete